LMLTDAGPVFESRGNNQPDAADSSHNRPGTRPMAHGKIARGQGLLAREQESGARQAPTATEVRFRFVGATSSPAISGLDKLASTTNYLIGADPAGWHSGVPNYARVKYEGAYPGIDLVYYGAKGNLEYDAVVAPGADPAAIQLEVDGAASFRVEADGQLVAETAAGPMRQAQPHIYQMIGGVRQTVTGSYQLTGPNRAGFTIGQYDHSRELVIDPDVVYTTTLGGSKATFADAIAVDSQGNAYISGGTTSPDFPTKNPVDGTLKGLQNAFITKLDPKGNVLFSTFLGGSGIDEAFGIGVDSTGIYVGGATSSRDFPTTGGGLQSSAGGFDAFAAKLSLDGSSLVYSSLLGGTGDDIAFGIAVSPGQGLPAGAVVITGLTKSTNLPTKNPFQSSNQNARGTGFVTAMDQTGKALIYSSYLGGSGADAANGIAIDAQGNVYITGTTNSSNFPATPGVLQSKASGGLDAFISAVSTAGTLTASTFFGGTGDDQGVAIAIVQNAPGDQDVVVACSTASASLNSGPHPIQTGFMGQSDAYIGEIDHALQNLKNGTYLGGGQTMPISVTVDSVKNICVAGVTNDAVDLPRVFPAALGAPNPGKDNAFLTVFNFNFPTSFPDNVITSSVFSLGNNNSDITACALVRLPATGGLARDALTGQDQPANQTGSYVTFVPRAGTADSATNQNAQSTFLDSLVIADVTLTKDAIPASYGFVAGAPVDPEKDAPAITSVVQGELFWYRLTVHNNSQTSLSGLSIDDALPLGIGQYNGVGRSFDNGSFHDIRWSGSDSEVLGSRVQSPSFNLGPGETKVFYLYADAHVARNAAPNTATLLGPVVPTPRASYSIDVTATTVSELKGFDVQGKQGFALGTHFDWGSSRYFSTQVSSVASGSPVLVIDGNPQKTVPDQGSPDALLIAPKAGKKIKPGQTVTIQVQFPDGSTTNSITYTRPTG